MIVHLHHLQTDQSLSQVWFLLGSKLKNWPWRNVVCCRLFGLQSRPLRHTRVSQPICLFWWVLDSLGLSWYCSIIIDVCSLQVLGSSTHQARSSCIARGWRQVVWTRSTNIGFPLWRWTGFQLTDYFPGRKHWPKKASTMIQQCSLDVGCAIRRCQRNLGIQCTASGSSDSRNPCVDAFRSMADNTKKEDKFHSFDESGTSEKFQFYCTASDSTHSSASRGFWNLAETCWDWEVISAYDYKL